MYKERLKELREEQNLNQTQLGKTLGMTQRAYSHYERGDRQIPIETWCRLAEYFNTSIDYLVGRTNEKHPYPKPENEKGSSHLR